MACLGCSCGTGKEDKAGGCNSNGGCGSGGCNRHNVFDWITAAGIRDVEQFDIVEVSFKNGSRKEFFKTPPQIRVTTGDNVLVESYSGGYDLGKITLSGELVRMQMKRKRVRNDAKLSSLIRVAHQRDMERLDEVRRMEKEILIRARVITRALDLQMKICDIEFQGDGRKCTFFYTAEGRVDFRELIRHYAKEFKLKIEMRQIGARQESARIGGLGNCGRELCCSTWLTEFKSVNTAAARYQNLAINQTKLSGMCGRLKCCLNYELDTYIDALEDFPEKADKLKTQQGLAILVKTDVFKRLMFYTYAENRGKFYPLHVDQVWETIDYIKKGQIPVGLEEILATAPQVEEEEEEVADYENIHDVIQLPIEKRKKKKKKKKHNAGESRAAAIEKEPGLPMAIVGRGQNQPRGDNRQKPQNQQNRGNQQGRPNPERPPRDDRQNNPNAERPPRDGQPRNPNQGQNKGPKPGGNNRGNQNRRPDKPGGGGNNDKDPKENG